MTRKTIRRSVAALAWVLLPLMTGSALARDPFAGPTVVIEPGDITPLRGPNIRNPLGPSSVYAPIQPLPRPSVRMLESDLNRDLRNLPSRTVAQPERPIPTMRLENDRERAAAALEAFRTLRPNDPATPLLERQLDRAQRPTDLGQ
jgi:hypothetical protein